MERHPDGSIRVRIWTTEEELDQWRWMAEKAQLPLATWIKRRLNEPETEAATKPVRL